MLRKVEEQPMGVSSLPQPAWVLGVELGSQAQW